MSISFYYNEKITMPPINIIISFLSFLKELVFGKNKRPNEPLPSKVRKFIVLSILVVSLTINYFSIPKLINITSAYIRLEKENKTFKEKLYESEKCEITLEATRRWLENCKPASTQ